MVDVVDEDVDGWVAGDASLQVHSKASKTHLYTSLVPQQVELGKKPRLNKEWGTELGDGVRNRGPVYGVSMQHQRNVGPSAAFLALVASATCCSASCCYSCNPGASCVNNRLGIPRFSSTCLSPPSIVLCRPSCKAGHSHPPPTPYATPSMQTRHRQIRPYQTAHGWLPSGFPVASQWLASGLPTCIEYYSLARRLLRDRARKACLKAAAQGLHGVGGLGPSAGHHRVSAGH